MGRLTRRAEFVRVSKGLKQVTPSCVVQARPSDEPDGVARAGFTATKAIGGAVARNRAKRRLREAARRLLPRLGRPGVDYVFIARRDTGSRDWGALLDDIETALVRLAAAASDHAPDPGRAPDASAARGRRR